MAFDTQAALGGVIPVYTTITNLRVKNWHLVSTCISLIPVRLNIHIC